MIQVYIQGGEKGDRMAHKNPEKNKKRRRKKKKRDERTLAT